VAAPWHTFRIKRGQKFEYKTHEATAMDRRWQLVLHCLGIEHVPFSKGTLVAFRRRLSERRIAIANQSPQVAQRAGTL
jgi:hypothetical protein